MEGGPKRERGPSLKVFVEYLAYGVFRVLEEFFCWVPSDNTALAVGRFFGRLMFVVAAPRRQVAIENLTTAFGEERSSQEIQVIARKNFEHLAMLGVEFFRIRRWSQEKLAEKLVLEGHEPYNLAWMPGREGRFYITAHFGTFEVLAATSRFLGLRGNLIVTPAPNRFVNVRMFFR
ncbi:MAG: hypothetical protein FJY85_02465, partial [Deltaproteobacteria bacterium]|nr:hypothetical protein [Deltaproteobacteria bacterium]